MKLAVISYHTCPLANEEGKETGGMNIYVYELSRELARLGHEVDVFTRSQDEKNEKIVDVEKGFRVVHLAAGPEQPVPKKELMPYVPEFVGAFRQYCSTHDRAYDILHAHYYLSGIIARAINESMPVQMPIVLSFHTLALMKNLVARDDAEKEGRARIEAEIALTKAAQIIISPSESDANYLHYLYEVPREKITVIPPGVDTTLFRPIDKVVAKEKTGLAQNMKYILFVGRIEPLKGIDVLMYAMKILMKRNPNIPLSLCVVGGDGPNHPAASKTLKSLEMVRQTLRLTATVDFISQQTQQMLPYYYNAAEMVVMPSHYESFGMVALEAMSCGTPVITTNVAGISSLFDEKHSALITSVNNPLLLATQMEQLLHNPAKGAEISSSIHAQVSDLSWDKIATRIVSVYEGLLKG